MEAPPTALAASADPGARWDRRARLAVLVALALLVSGAWFVGPTFDEHYYVASGYSYWKTGIFALNREHPPLVKLLTSLPLLFLDDVWWSDRAQELIVLPQTWFYQFNGAHYRRNLFLARLPICLATAGLGWIVYRMAKRFASARAAFFALCVLLFNPNVLAHGRLAALDGGLAVFFFLAVLGFAELCSGFTWSRLLAAGVTFGLANLAKFTALVLGPLYVALAAVAALGTRSARPFVWCAGTFLVGLGVFAAGYGFESRSVAEVWAVGVYNESRVPEPSDELPAVLAGSTDPSRTIDDLGAALDVPERRSAALAALTTLGSLDGGLRKRAFAHVIDAGLPEPEVRGALAALAGLELTSNAAWRAWWEVNRDEDWNRELLSQAPIAALTRGLFGDERPIPLFTALKGLDFQMRHASGGHGSFFRGRPLVSRVAFEGGNPHPEYYLVVLAVKNPIAFSVLALVGLVVCLRPRGAWTSLRLFAFVGPPAVLLALLSVGNGLMGVKYVLPIFPFVALWIARAVDAFPRAGAALAILCVLEGALLLPEAAPTHPAELMYYNAAAGGPVGGPWTTVVGDDWGQDVPAVGRFYRRHAEAIERAGGLYYDPYSRADPALYGLDRARRVVGRPRGILAVHAVDYYRLPSKYGWLREYEPFARLGWSVYLYDTRVAPPGGDPLARWEQD